MNESGNGGTALENWIGRSREVQDVIDLLRAQGLQATLDDPAEPLQAGDSLPPLWHWAYFWEPAPTASLGPDGHAARGEFLPPVELPRRMWAGSRLTFPDDLKVGREACRRSTIESVVEKQGRSGRLTFVTVRHEIYQDERLCIDEAHDIVYREAASPGKSGSSSGKKEGEAAPAESAWRRVIDPSPVLLFRYSALTFNGHRIHYDRSYVTQEEGYPGLIVHGPLLATLMIGQIRRERPEARVTAFAFTAQRPIFDLAPFTVAGRSSSGGSADLWVADSDGNFAMKGEAAFS